MNLAEANQQPLDLVIVNGTVVDGTGAARYRADVGVIGDSIVEIGELADRQAERVVDAEGLTVVPGFIDLLHNGDMGVLQSPSVDMARTQGITTALVGLCGVSMAPVPESPEVREQVRQHAFFKTGPHDYEWHWNSVGEYLDAVDGASAVNVATCAGFDNIWFAVRGFDMTPPSSKELARMRDLARDSMDEGAIGMSHGAGAASSWSTHEETVEVAKGIAERGGWYLCHQRRVDDGDPFSWVREGIAVGDESGMPIHFVHFKSIYTDTHGRERELVEVVHEARARGSEVSIGSYPYASGGGGFRVIKWAEEGGPDETRRRLRDPEIRKRIVEDGNSMWAWDTWVTGVRSEENKWMEGRFIQDIAREADISLGEVVARIVEFDYGAQHVHFHGGDHGLDTIMQDEGHAVGSDAIYYGTRCHPRCYGTYGRYLGHYVRETGTLSFEECIRHMTSNAARVVGLTDRGELAVGKKADIVILNEQTVADRATDEDPARTPVGFMHVIVNGRLVQEDGAFTGETPGRALRRQDA